MECSKAAAAEDGDGGMVAWELEAAEALAGMARCSVSQHVMEPVVISQELSNAPSNTLISPPKPEKHIPTHLCTTSPQSNPVMMKFRRKLTEAEKEERKLRHIMANRESARQTIRRRQAMHLELTKKATDELEENENLKKQKDLMVDDFNSLKVRNESLKAQLAEAKKVEAGDIEEEPNSYEPEKICSTTATPPIFQPPSLVPCFWPSLVPSSDVFPFQCASHPHPHPLQFPVPPGDTPCLHQGQQLSTVTPFFIVPVPCLLAHTTTTAHYCGKFSCSGTRLSEDQNMRAEAYNSVQTMSADSDRRAHQPPAAIVVPGLFSPVRRLDNSQVGDLAGLGKPPEDMVVAMEARRRRKELMRLKNINCK